MAGRQRKETITISDVELTLLEVKILLLLIEGQRNKEIARQLNYSLKMIEKRLGTTEKHYSLYNKIGVRSRTEAVAWCYKRAQAFWTAVRKVFGPLPDDSPDSEGHQNNHGSSADASTDNETQESDIGNTGRRQ